MLVYGELSERGKWTDGITGRVFDCEYSNTTVCETEEEARKRASDEWNSLCQKDRERTRLIVTKRDVTEEVIEDIKDRYYGIEDMKEIEEIAVSENYDEIQCYSVEDENE